MGMSENERTWDEAQQLQRDWCRVWDRYEAGQISGDQVQEEALSVLRRASPAATRMATRQLEIRNQTMEEDYGVTGYSALKKMRALLQEMMQAAEHAGRPIDTSSYDQRLKDLSAELEDEIRRDYEQRRSST